MKATPKTDPGKAYHRAEIAAAKPVVAIVGRQNTGKSTLLNRLAGRQIAIVEDTAGTTRDRIFASVCWQGKEFTLVDSGGLEPEPGAGLLRAVNEQVRMAISEADIILFLVDVKDGVTASELEITDLLRNSEKPVLLVANKADNDRLEAQAAEFFSLGLGQPLAISAYHGRGISELLERLIPLLPVVPTVMAAPELLKLAIVGRPNVGKSMLLNALLGKERAIVDDIPGTTRDALDTPLDFEGQSMLIIDTAGIRRRGQQQRGVERYSVLRALRAIDRADVALLLLDATELVTAQDMHVAGYIQQAAKGIVVVVNKWDLAMGLTKAECRKYIRDRLRFIAYAPLMFISAKLGQGVAGVLPQAQQIYQERLRRIATTKVNSAVQQAVAAHTPPGKGGKRLKFLYTTQAGVNPPTFVFFVNDAALMHFSYQRYLENRLRRSFGFAGTPLRLVFKTRGEQ